MGELYRLDGRKILIKLKHGATKKDFCAELNCTEDELVEFLEKGFQPSAIKGILKSMEKNEKRRNRLSKNSAVNHQKQGKVQEQKNGTENSIVINNSKDYTNLNKYKDDEKILSTEIRNLEIIENCLKDRKKELYAKLAKHKEELIELKRTIMDREKDINSILLELKDAEQQLEKKHEEILKTKGKLEKATTALEKISIFAYENGDIDIENSKEVCNINKLENKWLEKILLDQEAKNEMSVRQAEQLSYLFEIAEKLEESSTPFELVFESEKIEKIYHQISQQLKEKNL